MTTERRAAFEKFLAEARAKRAALVDAIGDVSNGAILGNAAGTQWAFILPDVSEVGKWRVQTFDLRGFSGHSIYGGQAIAIENAITLGCTIRDDEALDRAQQLPSFWRGCYAADLIRQVNGGQLTFDEANRLMLQYDAEREPLAA